MVCWSPPYEHTEVRHMFGKRFYEEVPWAHHDTHWGLLFFSENGVATAVSIRQTLIDYDNVTFPSKCLCGEVSLARDRINLPLSANVFATGEWCWAPGGGFGSPSPLTATLAPAPPLTYNASPFPILDSLSSEIKSLMRSPPPTVEVRGLTDNE